MNSKSPRRTRRATWISSLVGLTAAAAVAATAACTVTSAPPTGQSSEATGQSSEAFATFCGAWEYRPVARAGSITPECLPCGGPGEPACLVSQLTPAQCRNGQPLPAGATVCSARGCAEVGDPCCPGFTSYCVGGLTCSSGACVAPATPCGKAGAQCCWSLADHLYDSCGAGLGCKETQMFDAVEQSVSSASYQCQTCGAAGDVPCPTGPNEGCNAGLAPLDFFGEVACTACGGVNDIPCVSGSACTSGASVSGGLCECGAGYNTNGASCAPCGGPGEVTCTSGSACTSNASASGGTCTCNARYIAEGRACAPCGGSGEPACASGGACNSGLNDESGICCPPGDVNSGGRCVACGGNGQPACNGGKCASGLVDNGGVCTCANIGQKGTCCSGLEPNENDNGICATADPPNCGVTTIGNAPPCCKNKRPCDGDGICETDHSVSPAYQYCCSPSAEHCSSN